MCAAQFALVVERPKANWDEVGRWVARRRVGLKMSRAELARKADIDADTLRKLEDDGQPKRDEQLARISEVLCEGDPYALEHMLATGKKPRLSAPAPLQVSEDEALKVLGIDVDVPGQKQLALDLLNVITRRRRTG